MWYHARNERSLFRMFGHCTVEAMPMHWVKKDLWKAGIAIAGLLLLLVLMVWVPVSAADVREVTLGLATPGAGTVQTTPTEDAAVTALNKEKLAQEVQQLKNQNDRSTAAWFWNSGGLLGTVVAALLAVAGVLATVVFNAQKERTDRTEAQDKDLKDKAEERFKTAVTALGDEKEGVQLGGAILLRSFLNKDDKEIYGRYYTQIFDLAVAYLRLPRTSNPPEDPDGIPHSPEDPNAPLPLTTLRQALIVVFKEAFPLARRSAEGSDKVEGALQYLDATGIQLDNAYLVGADLKQIWMPQVSLRYASLSTANLSTANLSRANLSGANLTTANFSGADLSRANLTTANLTTADLSGADLSGADLSGADLTTAKLITTKLKFADLSGTYLNGADLSGANLNGANFSSAYLYKTNLSKAELIGANLSKADLSEANLSGALLGGANLRATDFSRADFSRADFRAVDSWGNITSGENLKEARSLKDANLQGIQGLTKEQLEAYKVKGAIIDEDSTTNSSQSPVSPPAPSQSNDAQAPSAPPAQVSIPTPDTGGSSAPSSKLGPES